MRKTTVVIKNRAGLHTRPAAMLVKLTSQFKADAFLIRDGARINAKSIIGVMTLAAEQGSTLRLEVSGPDEDNSFREITGLFESGFGEL